MWQSSWQLSTTAATPDSASLSPSSLSSVQASSGFSLLLFHGSSLSHLSSSTSHISSTSCISLSPFLVTLASHTRSHLASLRAPSFSARHPRSRTCPVTLKSARLLPPSSVASSGITRSRSDQPKQQSSV
jgi:hypothetical protein